MSFTETHTVCEHGAPTWPEPDPSLPETQRLDPFLPVQLLEARGDWWHVRCSNGWETWTDGRWIIHPTSSATPAVPQAVPPGYPQPGAAPAPAQAGYVPAAAQPAYPQPTPAQPGYLPATPPGAGYPQGGWAAPAPRPARPTGPTPAVGLRTDPTAITAAVGGGIAVLSTFLPWFSFLTQSVDGWDVPIAGLLDETSTSTDGVKVGLLVLLSGAALVALVVKLPSWAYWLLGLPAVIGAVLAIRYYLSLDERAGLDLSIGVAGALVGGLVIAGAGFLRTSPR